MSLSAVSGRRIAGRSGAVRLLHMESVAFQQLVDSLHGVLLSAGMRSLMHGPSAPI